MKTMWMTEGPRDVVVMRFITLGLGLAGLVLAVVGFMLYA